ncbi:MAG TPA: hypothetical protein VF701_09565 [Thermoanaerobaculia bacterium]
MLSSRTFWIALAAHVLLLLAVMPASPWEFDEPLFFQALDQYDPLAHHPPPPGYPLFIHVAQIVRLVVPSDFATLMTISLLGSIAGFVLLALAFRNLAGDDVTGVAGAWLFYVSPAMLVHSTLPISEPGAIALLAAALYFLTRNPASPALFALFAALAVGWRIQFSIFVVPLFLTALPFLRRRDVEGFARFRPLVVALVVFTLVCIAWLVPLTIAVGGVPELIAFERGQGEYLAAQDAAESRTGWTPARIAFRFIGRAWGTEWMALGLLALAGTGFLLLLRARLRIFIPIGVGAATYIAFALAVMDPADGVRYAIPFVLTTAFLAAFGAIAIARRLSVPPLILPLLLSVAFAAWVSPLLIQRRTSDSPPVRAAEYARANFPPGTVVLYELPLWPHATYFLGQFDPHRVDDGLEKFYDRPEVPLFIYADGATSRSDARVFAWKPSDAYLKLTRNHYRATSIIPVPPERRFRAVRGVYAPEREQDGLEWRWLDPAAEIQLPQGGERMLTIRLGLPSAAPLERNQVSISVDGRPAGTFEIVRGDPRSMVVPVPAGAPIVRIEAEESFVPAEVPSLRSGDRRRLAVELYELVTAAPQRSGGVEDG